MGKYVRVNDFHKRMYEAAFNAKADHFKGHEKYGWLRKEADKALRWHTGFGLHAIKARDFMDRLVVKPLGEIEAWLGDENALMWSQAQLKYGTERLVLEAYTLYAEENGFLAKGSYEAVRQKHGGVGELKASMIQQLEACQRRIAEKSGTPERAHTPKRDTESL